MKSSISTNRHQTESGAGLRVIIPKGILVTYKSGIGITKKRPVSTQYSPATPMRRGRKESNMSVRDRQNSQTS